MARLIFFVFVFIFFLVFIVFNLENKSDISFGFITLHEIPVFLSCLFSFVLGMLVTIPLAVSFGGRKRKKAEAAKPQKVESGSGMQISSSPDDIKKEKSSYGID